MEADFSNLRESISSLQKASASLDSEKHAAEHQVRKIMHELLKRRHHGHGLHCHLRRGLCSLKRAFRKIRKWFGFESSCSRRGAIKDGDEQLSGMGASGRLTFREGRASAMIKEAKHKAEEEIAERHDHSHLHGHKHKHGKGHGHHSPNKRLLKKLAKAVKRVQAANKKLIGFERGFIHEDGLKDRAWYRHLGVAPGKWLGASTFDIC